MSTASYQRCPGCFQAKGAANPCPHCGFDETAPRPVQALPLRTVLNDQFIVGRVLGKPGGFGITYLAWDRLIEATVAIKEYLPRELVVRAQDSRTLHPHSHEETDLFRYGLEQFLAEARTLAKLDHPNLVRVRQFFEANGTAYLVMDYYDGLSLAEHLDQQGGRLAEETAVSLILPILDGLRAVHAKGFLHRDVKPQNIYLAKTDTGGTRPILLDFGAARQAMGERSRSLSVVISAGYAPLEQYQRKGEQGSWTDVHAAAAVLYRAVTGHEPAEAIERIPDDNLLPAADFGVSAALSEVLGEALAVSPNTRPSILDFQRRLHKESASVDEPSRENSSVAIDTPQPVRTYPKHRQVVWVLIPVLALSVPLLALWQPWNQDQIDQPNPVVRDQVEPSESPAAVPPTGVEEATKSPEPPLPAATEPKTITEIEPPSPPAAESEAIVEVEPPLPSVAEPETVTEVEPSEPSSLPADESEAVTEIEPASSPAAMSEADTDIEPILKDLEERFRANLDRYALTSDSEDEYALANLMEFISAIPTGRAVRWNGQDMQAEQVGINGLEQIVDRYLDLAFSKISKRDVSAARKWLRVAKEFVNNNKNLKLPMRYSEIFLKVDIIAYEACEKQVWDYWENKGIQDHGDKMAYVGAGARTQMYEILQKCGERPKASR